LEKPALYNKSLMSDEGAQLASVPTTECDSVERDPIQMPPGEAVGPADELLTGKPCVRPHLVRQWQKADQTTSTANNSPFDSFCTAEDMAGLSNTKDRENMLQNVGGNH
jgi:hypothetical protein